MIKTIMTLERIALFIDGSYIYAVARRLGWSVDHRRVIEHFRNQGELYNGFYFAPITDASDDRQQKFVDALTFMGYTVRSREVHGERPSFEAYLATDMLLSAPRWNEAVLVSGSADLVPAVEALRSMGKEVRLLGIPELTDLELRNISDDYLDLRDMRDIFEREEGGRRSYPDVGMHEGQAEGHEHAFGALEEGKF